MFKALATTNADVRLIDRMEEVEELNSSFFRDGLNGSYAIISRFLSSNKCIPRKRRFREK